MTRREPSGSQRRALEALGLSPTASALLSAYLDLVAAWGARVNLTGARSAPERTALLVGAVLPVAPLLEPGELVDVGSGNGSPGLVLALLRPELKTTLLEPRARRWAFLREAARSLGRTDIEVLRLRHDAYPGPPAQNVTLRALRLPLAALAPLVREGGQLLVLGGAPEPGGPLAREATSAAGGLRVHVFRRTGVPRET